MSAQDLIKNLDQSRSDEVIFRMGNILVSLRAAQINLHP